ncbi:MAG: HEPN domain-containing protein [candidate division NC10 bacterium]
MRYDELRAKGLLDDATRSGKQGASLGGRAAKDLQTAKATLPVDREWAYTMAAQGMVRAARALVLAEGLRPKGREQVKTVLQVAGGLLSADFIPLMNQLERMRRKSQQFLEAADRPISVYEGEVALKAAEEFVQRVLERIQEKSPQRSLL